MASFGTQSVANGADTPSIVDTVMLGSIMNRVRAQAAADPFSNPILLFALDLTLRIDRGEINARWARKPGPAADGGGVCRSRRAAGALPWRDPRSRRTSRRLQR